MKSLKNIYFSDNFYIRNKIYSLNEGIITQKDFLGKLVSKIKERPMILGISGVSKEQDIYDKLEENYSKKSDVFNRTKEYYYKLYVENYIKNKQINDIRIDKSLVDSFEEIEDLGEKFNKIYERLSSKEYFEKKYREKIEKLESDRVKRVEILKSKPNVKIPVGDLDEIIFNEQQFEREWDIESRLFIVEGNIGLEIFKVVELLGILESIDKKSEKSAEEILQKQLRKYEGLDGSGIEFREIKKLYDYIDKYIVENFEVNIDQCIEAADFYIKNIYIGLDEQEKKQIDAGEFDFKEIMVRMFNYIKYKSKLFSDKFSLYKDCELIYEDDNFILVYPKTNFAFNDALKYFNAEVTWCTQKVSTWLNYKKTQYVCILNDKRLKPGDENYLISFKIAKDKMESEITGEIYDNGKIAFEECCDYNNEHMSEMSINRILGDEVLNKLVNICYNFADAYIENEIDGKDFIEQRLLSFIKMNKVNDIFKICYEICIKYIDLDNFEDFILQNIIKNLYILSKQEGKLNIFYEITNKIFVNLTYPMGFYIKINDIFRSMNEKSVIINLINNLLSLCKTSNIHPGYFIAYKNLYEILKDSIDISFEDKILIFSNALKTNNYTSFMNIVDNIHCNSFFIKEYKDISKKEKIFKTIYLSKKYFDVIEDFVNFFRFRDFNITYINKILFDKKIDDFSSFSELQFMRYIFFYYKDEIIKLLGFSNSDCEIINENIVKVYFNDLDINNLLQQRFKHEDLIDIVNICLNEERTNNNINNKIIELKTKINEDNVLIKNESFNIENILNNAIEKLEDDNIVNFYIHQLVNLIFRKDVVLKFSTMNDQIYNKIIEFIDYKSTNYITVDELEYYSAIKVLNLYNFIKKQFELFGFDFTNIDYRFTNILFNLYSVIFRYNYIISAEFKHPEIKKIINETFLNNSNIFIFDIFLYIDTKNEFYILLDAIISEMFEDDEHKRKYELLFLKCFETSHRFVYKLMNVKNMKQYFSDENFEYITNFIDEKSKITIKPNIFRKIKITNNESLLKQYIKLLLK